VAGGGFADYVCHRASSIELTTGYKESLIHLLMFSEVAVPLLAAIFFEINALIIALMIAGFIAHQLTALWDVSFANDKRYVSPIEQQIHSLLEVVPLAGLLIVIILNWPQFLSLWGLGAETPRFRIALKPDPLPWTYVVAFLSAVLDASKRHPIHTRCTRIDAGEPIGVDQDVLATDLVVSFRTNRQLSG
jgi:hypothetical protein